MIQSPHLHAYWCQALREEHHKRPDESMSQYSQRISHLAHLAIEHNRELLPLVEERLHEERVQEQAERPMTKDEVIKKHEAFKERTFPDRPRGKKGRA